MDCLISSIRDSLLYGNNVAAITMAVRLQKYLLVYGEALKWKNRF